MPRLTREQSDQCRQRAEDGESLRSLSQSYGLDYAGLWRKAEREGWDRPATDWRMAARIMVAKRRANVQQAPKRTPANAAALCKRLAEDGLPMNTASGLVGLSEETIRQWRQEDEGFDTLIREAIARAELDDMRKLKSAGDWRAARERLALRNKDAYALSQGGAAKADVEIRVVLDMPMPTAREQRAGDDALDITGEVGQGSDTPIAPAIPPAQPETRSSAPFMP